MIGSLTPADTTDLLDVFYSDVRFSGITVFDPFMGSGTTLGETLKLGADAIGRDINPVSYLQVRTSLTLKGSEELEETFHAIEEDVADDISKYYRSSLQDGTYCRVLYYFWVMTVPCPNCDIQVDLFSKYIFARHAYTRRNPTVHVVCPACGAISPQHYRVRQMECTECNHCFDATKGHVAGKRARCSNCLCEFAIGRTVLETGSPPSYRMYAKLVLTNDGKKEYQPITRFDEGLYQEAVAELQDSSYHIPEETIDPGYNTNQILNYGFTAWNQLFNARQLLCISKLMNRIREIDDVQLRDAFTCLFSGVLEFNNMFASYKGEGTGAVRPMFYHHILKPERTPLEANIWGTPKSSGAFSTLFRSRLKRAVEYAREPFELAISPVDSRRQSFKVKGIGESLTGHRNSDSYCEFAKGSRLYVSCGDSASTDIPDKCVDLIVTDPPFFDNVHYSQLADFFYTWQKQMFDDSPHFQLGTTRSTAEVQNSDVDEFTERLAGVLREAERVLKDSGMLVMTYHHSRWEGWRSVLSAMSDAGFRIVACHPVKSELSVATPKHQAKSPINFDIVVVCRKERDCPGSSETIEVLEITSAFDRAEAQLLRLHETGWVLSRNDVGVVVMGQVMAEISRYPGHRSIEGIFREIECSVTDMIMVLYNAIFKPSH